MYSSLPLTLWSPASSHCYLYCQCTERRWFQTNKLKSQCKKQRLILQMNKEKKPGLILGRLEGMRTVAVSLQDVWRKVFKKRNKRKWDLQKLEKNNARSWTFSESYSCVFTPHILSVPKCFQRLLQWLTWKELKIRVYCQEWLLEYLTLTKITT